MDADKETPRIAALIRESETERARVRTLVREGLWRKAEPDHARMARFTQKKIARTAPPGAEAIVGPTIDLQAANFLTRGVKVRRAVAYVEANGPLGSEIGSGFLVSPALFLTCRHVIPDVNAARGTQITFDRELDEAGRPKPTTTYLLDPERFALFSAEEELDYALIAVGALSSGICPLGEFGCCPLSDTPDRHVIGMNVNIIQHPRGWQKMIAVRNNLLTYRTDRTLLYETDTYEGSSGAAVYNDDWDVIALHHWGQPFLARIDDQGGAVPAVNEGVRISAIYRDLQSRLQALPAERQALLKEALALSQQTPVPAGPRKLSPPHKGFSGAESMHLPPSKGPAMTQPSGSNEFRVTIPIEISVRIGAAAPAAIAPGAAAAVAAPPAVPPRLLTSGPEALRIDTDYSNRNGYDPAFIPGANLPLPAPDAALTKQLAPLRAQEANAEEGELKYEHFSIKMNKSKRIAIFTATNIDGETYLTVDRSTGQVSGSEGETWFKDPRISASFFLDQSFYSDWSSYFDRGHLTRRTDPTWGSKDEAERANADTFHFTNCSPQHFRFNQTAQYWQGVERYVLENGVLAADSRKRLCVFQGPIFDDKIDLWSDDVQIPSSFFKIVVWKGATALKAVGLVVDQLPLLAETRHGLGAPHDLPSVDVTQWRVAIPQIEKRTGLDFGAAVRQADTIRRGAQPVVGEEAALPLRSLADLKDILT
jgi:endonuclease G